MTGRARRIGAVAGRELAAYFHAPIAYVVGVLFLAVQGFSFWAVVQVLADPARTAPLGAVLRAHFGGTFLYWSVLFVLVATAAMRLVAEDRRQGTWEALLTTPLEEGEAIVGKWLGALGYYGVLWLPTLSFPIVLRVLAPPGSAPELAPMATAYLGVALSGAGLLAVALAASAATANQVIAAVSGFVALMALLLIGQLPDLAPSVAGADWLRYVDLRAHMDAFARGDVDLRWVAFYLGMTAAGLAAAAAVAGIGRRRAADIGSRAIGAALVLCIAVLVNALVARHPRNWDVTAAHVNSLEDRTRVVLAAIDEPTVAYVIHGDEEFEEIYDEVERLLRRMAAAQPALSIEQLDPVRQQTRIEQLAEENGVPAAVLRGAGAVVFVTGDRARSVELLDMAELGRDELKAGTLLRFRAEEAFASALLDLTQPERPTVCATSGHGELPVGASEGGRDATELARWLQRDGFRVIEIGRMTGGVPNRCRALLVIGPQRALDANEALAVAGYLERGGRLLLAVDAIPRDGSLVPHGLELVVAELGILTPDAVAMDPGAGVGIDFAWGAHRTYAADHPITAAFQERRLTVWTMPRVVLADGAGAVALVTTSTAGWAETDIARMVADGAAKENEGELRGRIPVSAAAVRGSTRVVVLGAARPLASDFAARGLGSNVELVTSAVSWLVGRTARVELGDKTPERVRLTLSTVARRLTFAICVVGLPLLWAALGAFAWWRRRARHG